MHPQLENTKNILMELRDRRGSYEYRTLLKLLESMQQDIRLHNDHQNDFHEILRNQGGVHWIGELVKQMMKDPAKEVKRTDTDVDGAYTDI